MDVKNDQGRCGRMPMTASMAAPMHSRAPYVSWSRVIAGDRLFQNAGVDELRVLFPAARSKSFPVRAPTLFSHKNVEQVVWKRAGKADVRPARPHTSDIMVRAPRSQGLASARQEVGAVLATGNRALVPAEQFGTLPALPPFSNLVAAVGAAFDAVLFDGGPDALLALAQEVAERLGPIVPVHVAGPDGAYPLDWLVRERAVSTNTTAAGGNANLMMIG